MRNERTIVLGMLCMFLGLSCTSLPDEATQQAFSESENKMEDSRKMAQDFESPEAAAAEWNATESIYNIAKALRPVSMKDYQAAIVQFDKVSAGYKAALAKAIPVYAAKRKGIVEDARGRAVAADSGNVYAVQLAAADDVE